MNLPYHLALAAGIVVAAALLVRIPRGLFAEAADEAPARRLEWTLGAALAVAGVVAYASAGDQSPFARFALALGAMILLAVVYSDLSFLVIPDLYSASVAVLAFSAPWRLPLVDALVGAALCGGLLAVVALVWRRMTAVEGLGFGDVKLAAAIGALIGAQSGLLAISISAAVAAVLAFGVRLSKRDKEAAPLVPYGAALALAGGGFLAVGFL